MKLKLILILTLGGLLFADSYSDILSPNTELTKRELHSLKLSKEWLDSKDKSFRGENGSVGFLYGATMPRIVAAPNRITDIQFEPGEILREVQLGDTVRWNISPSISGDASNMVSHVILKPKDSGLETTLVVFTDRRSYHFNLASNKKNYMPIVSFKYPENLKKKWDTYKTYMAKKKEASKFTTPTGTTSIENLNFNYSVKGSASWKPLRVYNNGIKTYISMPNSMKHSEAPILMVLDAHSNKQLVNYRLKGSTFIVDKIFDSAVLIVGVGMDQEKVTIQRVGTKHSSNDILDFLNNTQETL